MSSGKTHDLSIVITSAVLLPIAPVSALGCAVGGLLLSPDIDKGIQPVFTPRSVRRLNSFSPLWWFWSPFARFKHRSIWTHLPVLSTALKVGWVMLWIFLLLTLRVLFWGALSAIDAGWTIEKFFSTYWFIVNNPIAVDLVIGLAISDTVHWLFDGCPVHV